MSVPIAEANLAALALVEAGRSALTPERSTFVTAPEIAKSFARVPYGRFAKNIVCIIGGLDAGAEVWIAPAATAEILEDSNLAGEPRDNLRIHGMAEKVGAIASTRRFHVIAAACRAVLLSGVLQRVSFLTMDYARERIQFDRPIIEFQAVQQLLTETMKASRMADAITKEMVHHLSVTGSAEQCEAIVAAARVLTGQAASTAIRCAHQVHGAIGITAEYPLSSFTRRLMAWRDEDGSELFWRERLGQLAGQAAFENSLWSLITSVPAVASFTSRNSDLPWSEA